MVGWLFGVCLQNPEAARLKQCLMEMAAAKNRRLSSSSTSSDKSSSGMFIRRQNDVAAGSVHPVINAARYKTELCRSYSENGYCRYGDKCQFAHGAAELRSTVRHPRYKTELCKEYHTTGFCAYGSRYSSLPDCIVTFLVRRVILFTVCKYLLFSVNLFAVS